MCPSVLGCCPSHQAYFLSLTHEPQLYCKFWNGLYFLWLPGHVAVLPEGIQILSQSPGNWEEDVSFLSSLRSFFSRNNSDEVIPKQARDSAKRIFKVCELFLGLS